MRYGLCLLLIILLNGASGFGQDIRLYQPKNMSVCDSDTVIFRWTYNKTTPPDSFHIQFSTDPSFSVLLDEFYTGADTAEFYSGLDGNTEYWRVRGYQSGIPDSWSVTYSYFHFTPADIGGISLWIRADSNLTLNGGNVESWGDLSPNAHVLSQTNPAKQPTVNPAAFNNLPALHFSGSQCFSGGDILNMGKKNRTMFVVGKNQGGAFWAKAIFAGMQNRYSLYNDGSNHISLIHDNAIVNSSLPYVSANFALVKIELNRLGLTNSLWVNNQTPAQTNGLADTNYVFNSSFRFLIGAYNDGSDASEVLYLNGDISEVLFIDEILSAPDQQKLNSYLQTRYCPQLNLGEDITVSYGFADTLIDAGPGFSNYLWSTGDNTSSITVDSAGTYLVTVTDLLGFVSTDTIRVYYPVSEIQDTIQLCLGDTINVNTGLSGLYNFTWIDLTNGTSLDVSAAGKYWVIIEDSYGNSITDTFMVDVDSLQAKIWLGSDTLLCSGNDIALVQGSSLVSSYIWNPGLSTGSSLDITSSGTYIVSVTDVAGCLATDTIDVTVSGVAPLPDFYAPLLCSENQISLTDQSVPPDSIAVWQWIINGADTLTDENPLYVFNSEGIYSVSLTVTSFGGCKADTTGTLTVFRTPVAGYSSQEICAGHPAVFTDTSFAGLSESIVYREWKTDGTPSGNDSLQTLLFPSPGNYAVMLTVESSNGCTDSLETDFNITSTLPLADEFSLLLPYNQEVTSDTITHFEWSPDPRAISYSIQLAGDPLFSGILFYQNGITQPETDIHTGSFTEVYWRITAINSCNDSTTSGYRYFNRYSPAENSYLSLWITGDSTFVSSGSLIDSVPDLSGNGNHLVQSDLTKQPSHANFTMNNHKVIRFDGVNDCLDGGDILDVGAGSKTFFVVGRAENDGYYFAKSLYSSADARYACGINNSDNLVFFYFDNADRSIQTSQDSGEFNMYYMVADKTNSFTLAASDQSPELTSPLNPAFDMSSGFRFLVGAYNNSTDQGEVLNLRGEIAEIIVFDTLVVQQERIALQQYLRYKYCPPVMLGPDIRVGEAFCDTTIYAGNRFRSFLWSTGETTESITVNNPGTYYVEVEDVFGFISRDTINVTFDAAVTFIDTTICYGDSLIYRHLNLSNYLITWSNGDTGQVFTTTEAGIFDVKAENLSLGCYFTDTFEVKVDSLPVADFLDDQIDLCTGNSLFPELTSPSESYTYLWGNGDTTFTVPILLSEVFYLTVTSSIGCSGTDSSDVTVIGVAPVAGFTSSSTCIRDTAYFTDISTISDTSTITTWEWTFHDMTTSVITNPSKYYETDGFFPVTLTITTSTGCVSALTQNINIHPEPLANFSTSNLCYGLPTSFYNLSTIPNGSINLNEWNFGDSNTASGDTVLHTYSTDGLFIITLISTSTFGCRDTLVQEIEIKPSPTAGFDFSPACEGSTTYFFDTSKTQNIYPILFWNWDFGDNITSDQQSPSHIYSTTGIYDVELEIKSLNGCYSTFNANVQVSSTPRAWFLGDSTCLLAPLQLTDSTTIDNGSITTWMWSSSFTSTIYNQNPTLLFPDVGLYRIYLKVLSDLDCSDTVSRLIRVYPHPVAEFTVDPTLDAAPMLITIDNTSDSGTSFWTFGDGNTSTQPEPVHNLLDTGNYTITLIQTNSHGCTDQASQNVRAILEKYDLAVLDVSTTTSNNFLNTTAVVINLGSMPVYRPELILKSDKSHYISENLPDSLYAGEVAVFTFNASISTAVGEPEYVCVEVLLPAGKTDMAPDNNEACSSETEIFSILNLYPNPVIDQMYIEFFLPEDNEVDIEIFEKGGKLVFSKSIQADKGFNRLTFETGMLNTGAYTVKMSHDQESVVKEFVKM